MPDFLHSLQNGSGGLWLFIPSAILLGMLHGLEPGHSKTMMAAFIVAIRGTVSQAVLLGLSAAISHSLIIWALAAGALHFGSQWDVERVEPILQLGSAGAILALAAWMFFRTRRELHEASRHDHDHNAGEHPHHHHDHEHHHTHEGGPEFQDAHEREHAEDIARRFAGRSVSTPQILLFGITGGLMPCPAAFTVLLVCLQLKQVSLGIAMVGAFSFGLAITMVVAGALAALSVQHAQKRFRGFGELMRRAPFVSCLLLVCLALYMAWHGWIHLRTL
jgi:ABC-type nickel/cobalt efflux system permease component RcnA